MEVGQQGLQFQNALKLSNSFISLQTTFKNNIFEKFQRIKNIKMQFAIKVEITLLFILNCVFWTSKALSGTCI